MPDDVQLDEAPAALLRTARRVVPIWLRRVATEACERGGVDPSTLATELDRLADGAADISLARLADLLATDVDRQRTTPLSVFRDAISPVEEFLREHHVAAPAPSPTAASSTADVYRLEPATWSDIDPALHEPGLTWGAWKAMTVLARRRDEGVR